MENNYFKYFFSAFIVVIIILTGYYIAKTSKIKADSQTMVKKEEQLSPIQNDLRLGVAELDTMNPIFSNNRNVYEYSKLFYSYLVRLDAGYNLKYDLVKDITKLDDLNYEIIIRNDATWQNNSGKVTVKDVKFTIEQINNNKSLYNSNIENIEAITIKDDYTMVLKLKKPQAFFEYTLTFPIMKEVDAEFFKNKEQYPVPVTSGKYIYKESVNNTAIYEANTNYYEKFEPSIKNIIVTQYNSMGELYNSFKSGNIDLITTNERNIEQYIGKNGYQLVGIKDMNFTFLAINNEINNNADVKRGISKMIAFDRILEALHGNYIRSTYPLDYGSHLYKNIALNVGDIRKLDTSVPEAKALFQKSNFKGPIKILTNQDNEMQNIIATEISKQLNENGISVIIEKVGKDNYYNRISEKNYDYAIVTLKTSMTPNLDRFLGEGNILNYNNEEVRKLLNEAKQEKLNENTKTKLEEIYNNVENIYLNDMPFIGIVRNTKSVILNTGVTTDGNLNIFDMFQNIEKWYRR